MANLWPVQLPQWSTLIPVQPRCESNQFYLKNKLYPEQINIINGWQQINIKNIYIDYPAGSIARTTGLFILCPFHFTHIHSFSIASSWVSLSYIIIVLPMRKCCGQHSWWSFTFSIDILIEICSLSLSLW